jgi:hypothetical protein
LPSAAQLRTTQQHQRLRARVHWMRICMWEAIRSTHCRMLPRQHQNR